MSSHYRNPTANAAIGSLDREFRQMEKRAARIKARRKQGLLTDRELAAARKEFIGIYRRLLREALTDEPPPVSGDAPNAEQSPRIN